MRVWPGGLLVRQGRPGLVSVIMVAVMITEHCPAVRGCRVTSPVISSSDSASGSACIRQHEQRGPSWCCGGRSGVSNAALPVVVPSARGRAALLLPGGRVNSSPAPI